MKSKSPELGEVRWRAVFERAAVGISIIDPAGRFIASNPAHQEIMGYTADELHQMTFLDLTHEDDRSASGELGAQMFRGPGPRRRWTNDTGARTAGSSGSDCPRRRFPAQTARPPW